MNISFSAEDQEECLRQLHEQTERFGISYFAWCRMKDSAPGSRFPSMEKSFALDIGEADPRRTRHVDCRASPRRDTLHLAPRNKLPPRITSSMVPPIPDPGIKGRVAASLQLRPSAAGRRANVLPRARSSGPRSIARGLRQRKASTPFRNPTPQSATSRTATPFGYRSHSRANCLRRRRRSSCLLRAAPCIRRQTGCRWRRCRT